MLAALPSTVELVAYEGGQHWSGGSVEFAEWANSAEFYAEMLEAFAPHLDLFLHYTHSGHSGNGQWGARRSDGSADYKYQALVDWNSRTGTCQAAGG